MHIRAEAAAALSKIREPESCLSLKQLVSSERTEHVNDELKGWALQALWPEHLSVTGLFDALTKPKDESFIGAYWLFLTGLNLPAFEPTEAVRGLRWLGRVLQTPDGYSSFFSRLVPRVFVRVWEQNGDTEVREQLADLYTALIRTGEYFSLGESLKAFRDVYMPSPEESRRRFVQSILRKVINPSGVDKLAWVALTQPFHLVTKVDLSWLIETLFGTFSEVPEEGLIDLLVSLTFAFDINDLMPIWHAAKRMPALGDALVRAHSVELTSQSAHWQKEAFYRHNENKLKATNELKETLSSI